MNHYPFTAELSPLLNTWSIALRCHYTKSNPIDNHNNISSKKLQKQNSRSLVHYTCRQCGTSHLQTVQENILSRIILGTYRKFTVTTVRFTQWDMTFLSSTDKWWSVLFSPIPHRFNRCLIIHLWFLTNISASLRPINAISIQVTLGWFTCVPLEGSVAVFWLHI